MENKKQSIETANFADTPFINTFFIQFNFNFNLMEICKWKNQQKDFLCGSN